MRANVAHPPKEQRASLARKLSGSRTEGAALRPREWTCAAATSRRVRSSQIFSCTDEKGSTHMKVTWIATGLLAAPLLAACGSKSEAPATPVAQTAPAAQPKLGIRPDGDTKVSIDL